MEECELKVEKCDLTVTSLEALSMYKFLEAVVLVSQCKCINDEINKVVDKIELSPSKKEKDLNPNLIKSINIEFTDKSSFYHEFNLNHNMYDIYYILIKLRKDICCTLSTKYKVYINFSPYLK